MVNVPGGIKTTTPKRGLVAVLRRKKRGFPKVFLFDTADQGEVEMVMATLNLGEYYIVYGHYTRERI